MGEFGGEVDNWMWPRHTGDFSLVRVWADQDGAPAAYSESNVPLKPKRFLKIAREGVTKGSFVMIAGYPAKTYRSLVADEMEERAGRWFPGRTRLLREWHDMLVAAGKNDEEARILLADRVKGLANREKNARGQVAAVRRGRLLEKKRETEAEATTWAAERPEHRPPRWTPTPSSAAWSSARPLPGNEISCSSMLTKGRWFSTWRSL